MARGRDTDGKKIRHKRKKRDQDATSAADVDKTNKKKRKQDATNATNMDDGDNNLRAGDASDAKDAGITTEGKDAGRSANEATQDKTTVSLSGNLSELKQFPRLILTY